MRIWYRETILSLAFQSLISSWGRRTGLQRERQRQSGVGPGIPGGRFVYGCSVGRVRGWGQRPGSQTQLKGGLDALEIRPTKGCELTGAHKRTHSGSLATTPPCPLSPVNLVLIFVEFWNGLVRMLMPQVLVLAQSP